MRLPSLRGDGYTKSVQVQFGGYEHIPGAGEGAVWDMKNLCGDAYPLLATRPGRGLVRTLGEPWAIGAAGELYWVDGDGFFFGGKRAGTVAPGKKSFAGMGTRILIWPDKAVYNAATGAFESLEARVSGTGVRFGNGTLYGEEAERNTVTCAGIDFRQYFSEGDAVEISGCTKYPSNNKTPIVREISGDGHSLRFYENVLATAGTDEKPVDYVEPGTVTFARTVPDMDCICVNENRLWGCKGDTIYCSKLGDPKNFNVFDGLGTDSFAVDAGSAGEFTACTSFLGYPCFFKEDHIYKVYGDLPSNFQVMGGADLGVKKGCAASLAAAGNTLFYLSTAGFMAWSGGMPAPAGESLGGRFTEAVGGSDGLKYYVSARENGREAPRGGAFSAKAAAGGPTGRQHLFVYDTRLGLWHREDEAEAVGWACLGGTLFLLKTDGTLWDVTGRTGETEDPFEWLAEFADFTEGSPEAKGAGKLQLRLELEENAWARAELKFDSMDEWTGAGNVMCANKKRTFLLPIIPRREDHYRLRVRGEGGCVIHSVARQLYVGSENRTVRSK